MVLIIDLLIKLVRFCLGQCLIWLGQDVGLDVDIRVLQASQELVDGGVLCVAHLPGAWAEYLEITILILAENAAKDCCCFLLCNFRTCDSLLSGLIKKVLMFSSSATSVWSVKSHTYLAYNCW